ncbi:MAG: formate/nitrite transporter family protein [Mycobacteriales bacterium]
MNATVGEEREARLEESLDRIVEEGRPRLRRPTVELLSTGTVAGLEVGLGVLALLAVVAHTGSDLLGGLAFSVGFIALLLGHSELFTEGFLVPVTVVVAKDASVVQLLRLWGGTLAANLFGGWIITWFVMVGFPALHAVALKDARFFLGMGVGWRSLALAVLAGAAMTLMTRMQLGSDSMAGKLVASIAGAFLVAGLRLSHSILDSIVIFAAFHATGHGQFGYLDWLRWLGWTVVGNMVGGIGLVTLLRLLRSRTMLAERRSEN